MTDKPYVAPASHMESVNGSFQRTFSTLPGWVMHPVYGQTGMRFRFLVVGNLGALTFTMSTGWVPDRERSEHPSPVDGLYPMGLDFSTHWTTGNGDPMAENCNWFTGPCWYDSTALGSDRFLTAFLAGGLDAVWAALETEYEEIAERDSE